MKRVICFCFLAASLFTCASAVKGELLIENPRIKVVSENLIKAGFSPTEIKQVFKAAFLNSKIYEPEEKEFWLYKAESVQRGKNYLRENFDLLSRTEKLFGVEKEVLVSIHAIEVRFGDRLGKYKVLDTLLTRFVSEEKTDWIEKELISWLLFCKKTGTDLFSPGSNKGASGPMQLMPFTALNYAVSAGSESYNHFRVSDAFFSAANYLQKLGWKKDFSIKEPVKKHSLLKYNSSFVYVHAVKKYTQMILLP